MSDIKTQLEEQFAEIDWQDLIPHAQRDAIILVSPHLDMIEVGCAIAQDKTQLVTNWISEELIRKPTTDELSQWNNNPQQKFNTIIVQPFVLARSVN